jgi:hypothetical protein
MAAINEYGTRTPARGCDGMREALFQKRKMFSTDFAGVPEILQPFKFDYPDSRVIK